MIREQIQSVLKSLTGHRYSVITTSGDSAILSALSLIDKNKILLIPQEGGWLGYRSIPRKLGLVIGEVVCEQSKISLYDLPRKLQTGNYGALLYQNPGGYFAEQPMKEVYDLCKKYGCKVIMDVSGSLGTKLCDGNCADFMIGSFGEWKLVEAGVGGFISSQDKSLLEKVPPSELLHHEDQLQLIFDNLNLLSGRVSYLLMRRNKVLNDLNEMNLIHPKDLGFVVVVKYATAEEKERVLAYCRKNKLEWTECPRYIRLQDKAISIEIKRLRS